LLFGPPDAGIVSDVHYTTQLAMPAFPVIKSPWNVTSLQHVSRGLQKI